MTQAERAPSTPTRRWSPNSRLGSVLSGGGSVPTPNTPEAWADMVDAFQAQALSTPLRHPADLRRRRRPRSQQRATAQRSSRTTSASAPPGTPTLVEQAVEHVTAEEMRATGIPWDFAPCVCVTRDARWGRSYESFGEDPQLVSVMGRPRSSGSRAAINASSTRTTECWPPSKHFAGDGDTEYGTPVGDYTIDQGITVTSRRDFDRIDLAPYLAGDTQRRRRQRHAVVLQRRLDRGRRRQSDQDAREQELITGVLKGKIGFRRFRHQRLGGHPPAARRLRRPRSRIGVERRHRHVHGAQHRRRSSIDHADRPRSRRAGCPRRASTTRSAGSSPRSSNSACSSTRTPTARTSARSAPPTTGPSPGEAVAKSQVLLKNSGNALPLHEERQHLRRRAQRRRHRQPVRRLDPDLAGLLRAQRRWRAQQPGTTILEGIRQVAPQAQVTYSADGTAPTAGARCRPSSWSARRRTRRASATSAVRSGPTTRRTQACRGKPKSLELQPQDRAVVDRVCGQVANVRRADRLGPTADRHRPARRRSTPWSRPGCPAREGAGVADVLFGERGSPASCR